MNSQITRLLKTDRGLAGEHNLKLEMSKYFV